MLIMRKFQLKEGLEEPSRLIKKGEKKMNQITGIVVNSLMAIFGHFRWNCC